MLQMTRNQRAFLAALQNCRLSKGKSFLNMHQRGRCSQDIKDVLSHVDSNSRHIKTDEKNNQACAIMLIERKRGFLSCKGRLTKALPFEY